MHGHVATTHVWWLDAFLEVWEGLPQPGRSGGSSPPQVSSASAPGDQWGLNVVETPRYRISGNTPVKEYLALRGGVLFRFINFALALRVCIHNPVCIL